MLHIFLSPKPLEIQFIHSPMTKIQLAAFAESRRTLGTQRGCLWLPGARELVVVGAYWAGSCRSHMKPDHPGWRQELGSDSGKWVGDQASSPCPGLRQQAAAGTLRPCQSGHRYSTQPTKTTSASQSRTAVIGRVCSCRLGRLWQIFLGPNFPGFLRTFFWKW